MTVLVYLLIFSLGLAIGSFLNVIIFRLDREKGIVTGRSKCLNCLNQLRWFDLFPVISFLILRRKCRYCSVPISYVYLLTEIITASALTVYFMAVGFNLSIDALFYVFAIIMLILLIFFDWVYLILPDKVVLTLAGVSLIFSFFTRYNALSNLLLSGFLFGGVFAIIYLVSKGEWMGFGDAKLALAIGLILGYPSGLFAIILSVWSAAIFGLCLMIFKKASLKTALPFGSFLAISTILFIIFQNVIQEKIQIYQYFL